MLFMMSAEWSVAAMNALIKNPADRSQAAKQATEAAGGRMIAWYGMGGGDRQGMAVIIDVPDGTTVQAIYNASRASGALESIRVQRLYTSEEMVESFRKAQAVQKAYQPPS
jgi:uncharacterized protein with GYD domain